jgi:phosphatidylethanolamine/phosphatidyl-N-methylethanolamine N-methyltransferase
MSAAPHPQNEAFWTDRTMNPFPSTGRAPATTSSASLDFLRGFLRNPAQVGSVIPSSPQLEQRLVQCARVGEARSVVELGPGTGGTTRALLAAMSPAAVLLGIELDADFFHGLQRSIRDPRLILQQGSAEKLGDLLEEHGLAAPDAIVSGIPFSTMPPHVSRRIAECIAKVLRPGGRFVAYQVRAHVADFMTPHLGAPEKQWEMMNVPPMRVFTWIKR